MPERTVINCKEIIAKQTEALKMANANMSATLKALDKLQEITKQKFNEKAIYHLQNAIDEVNRTIRNINQ